ncbi:hypothetical protein [Roseomonas sp. 18066]|uniref:hypothetical protein n=1 Tax=Roseomonas sp. 18066 TaxID=2681412 RepID=UPI001357AE79|nr:hypothetical protein [Roseomonas sp. 18066]
MAVPPVPRQKASRPAPARAAAARGKGGGRRSLRQILVEFPWRRWLAVLICVAVLLVGVPLAVALVGDLGALLLLVGVGGFALGRATAPRPVPPPPRRKGKG